ncbi:MAG: peptidoglycan bridge formation glycyltransferase FemA/FemB family protein [bacterium]|nr:peptidoglycan bridge formation glycyltransferase FemA/FemB family protein [bacterium]
MQNLVLKAIDPRQTIYWNKYMTNIGWKVEEINGILVFIRQIKPFKHSLIKIQHAQGPVPLDEVDRIAKEHKALFVLIEPHCNGYSEKEYLEHGYRKSKLKTSFTSTRLIDISGDEKKIWESFSESARRNIKKSEKNKLRIEHIYTKDQKDSKYFDMFYKLYKLLGNTRKFYVLSYEECYQRYEAFKDGSLISFAYEEGNPEPIAVVWFLYYNDILLYNHTGITQQGYHLLANYLLVWEGIKQAKIINLTLFDFESIYDPRYPKENKKWIGYSEFKSRFHGEVVQYPHGWLKIYNIYYKMLHLCFTLFSS